MAYTVGSSIPLIIINKKEIILFTTFDTGIYCFHLNTIVLDTWVKIVKRKGKVNDIRREWSPAWPDYEAQSASWRWSWAVYGQPPAWSPAQPETRLEAATTLLRNCYYSLKQPNFFNHSVCIKPIASYGCSGNTCLQKFTAFGKNYLIGWLHELNILNSFRAYRIKNFGIFIHCKVKQIILTLKPFIKNNIT